MRTSPFRQLPLVALLALLLPATATAGGLPLWEMGLGTSAMTIPDYRGSDQNRSYALPFPYFVYRGERLSLDRGAFKGFLFKSEAIELDVSMNASVPVDSNKNGARRGMPDLDPTVELGPSVEVYLARAPGQASTIKLVFPLRGVIATDFSRAAHAGWVFNPHIDFHHRNVGRSARWSTGLSLGPLFADTRYHRFYYEVPEEYATAERAAYRADGGYSGARMTLTLSRRYPNYWFGSFLRYDSLQGAVFEDSPLVRSDQSLMIGMALTFRAARSTASAAPGYYH